MDARGSDLWSGEGAVVTVTSSVAVWLLVALGVLALVWAFRGPSRRRREKVMSCLATGARLGREIPLPVGVKYAVLGRMEEDGEIVGDETPDGRMYRLSVRSEAARRARRGTGEPGRS